MQALWWAGCQESAGGETGCVELCLAKILLTKTQSATNRAVWLNAGEHLFFSKPDYAILFLVSWSYHAVLLFVYFEFLFNHLACRENEDRSVSIELPPSALADIYNFISKDFESTDIFRSQSRSSRSFWFQYCFTTGLQKIIGTNCQCSCLDPWRFRSGQFQLNGDLNNVGSPLGQYLKIEKRAHTSCFPSLLCLISSSSSISIMIIVLWIKAFRVFMIKLRPN